MFKTLLLSIGMTTLVLGASAEVEQQETGWVLKTFEVTFDQRGTAIGDYTNSGWALEPADTAVPYLRFTCSPRHPLVATLYPRPEMLAIEDGKRIKQGVRKGVLHVEGRDSENVAWTHVKRRDIMQARRRSVSAKLYNAAATGADVRVRVPLSKDEVTFTSPKPDASFKRFLKECSIAGKSEESAD